MADEIDRLEVQVEAQATKANNSLDKLVKNMDRLSGSLSALNTNGLSNLASGVTQLGTAIQKMSGVKTTDFTRLAKNIEKLSKLNFSGLNSSASSVSALSASLNSLSTVTFDTKNLTNVINAITRLSKSNISGLNTVNFANLGNSLRQLTVEMSGSENVSRNTTSFITSVAKLGSVANLMPALTSSIGSLGTAMQSFITQMAMVPLVNESVIQFTSAIGNLANAGDRTLTTASNLDILATELKKFMTVMASAPTVNNSIIQMTNALANLAAQGSAVGASSRQVVKGLNSYGAAASAAKTKTLSLAAAFGKFYATWFLVIRGVKALWSSIESTADYIESFNYFNVALGKVASDWQDDFTKYGYSSADAYVESFTGRLNETLGKMSGVQIDTNSNLLTESGMKNLGLNVQEVTQYASQLASVTNSIGQTGEVTVAAAKSMTMLAGDISSLFNVDYSSVATNLQSGLIGQSRALYKYGIDITNATLQTYAYSLGLEKSVSEMTQAEKMQLRMLAILDQSKVSWGDLANTINSPSNMIRQFKNNLSELGTVLGQLFIPLLQKVLPIVNAVTIALKRLLVNIAGILGIELDLDSFGQGYSQLEDGLEDVSDAYDDVAESASNASKGTRAFDELKTISIDDGSSGSGSDLAGTIDLTDEIIAATEEYESVWNEAFESMQNKAEALADSVEKALEPIADIFHDFAIGDFFSAGQDVSNLVTSITDWFTKAIKKVNWVAVGKKIGKFMAGIKWVSIFASVAKLIWAALQAALETWAGAFSADPIETALITMLAFPKALEAITASKFAVGIKKLADGFKNVAINFNSYLQNLDATGQTLTFSKGAETIRNNLSGIAKGVISAVAVFAEFAVVSDSFEAMIKGSEDVVSCIFEIGVIGAAASTALYVALGPTGLAIAAITGVVAAIKGINTAFDDLRTEEIGNTIKNAFENPGGIALSELSSNFVISFENASSGFDIISDKSNELETVQSNITNTWIEIDKIKEAMDNGVLSVEEGKEKLDSLFSELAILTEQKFSAMNSAIMSAYGENGSLKAALDSIGADTENAIDTMITYGYQGSERAREISETLATMTPGMDGYNDLVEELGSLTGEVSEFSQATNDFAYNMNALEGQINYEDIFLPDGSIDTEALQRYLDDATNAVSEYETSLDEAGKNLSSQWQVILSSSFSTEEQKAEAQAQLDFIPQAIAVMKEDAESRLTDFTDMLQKDFIDKTDDIINENIKKWNEKSAVEQWWNGVWGAGTESEYVKEAVDQHNENIGTLSDEIEQSLKELGINGSGWSKEASEEIYNSLFDSQYIHSDVGLGHMKYTLNENYKEIINGATEGIGALASEKGKDAVDGYAEGFSNNSSIAEDAASEVIENTMDSIAETQDSHSPSKVTEKLGMYAVQGYGIGFTKNQTPVLNAAADFVHTFVSNFDTLTNSMHEIGLNAMKGMLDGITAVESDIITKTKEIADSVSNTMKTTLDINSPSRVMYDLGNYTMEGFQNGLESLYNPIEASIKDFSVDFELASFNMPESLYKNYTVEYRTPEFDAYSYATNSGNQDNEETNLLLRELLSAVKEGKVIKIGEKEVGKTVVSYIKGEEKRLQKSIVGVY